MLAFHKSVSTYILDINKLVCKSVFRVLNSKLEVDYNRLQTE